MHGAASGSLNHCIINTASSRAVLMLSALGEKREAELGSFMAVAEDEKIERPKKDSSVGQKKDTCCYIFKLLTCVCIAAHLRRPASICPSSLMSSASL